MSEGVGPFSALEVSALENHIQTVQLGDLKFAAIQLDPEDGSRVGCNVTTAMIFCRGTLRYNDQQELILSDMTGGGQRAEPGDWIVMLSRGAYAVMRIGMSESLFSLMPDVALCTPEERLSRIAQAHVKDVGEGGVTSGVCVECYQDWGGNGCPTHAWATKDRDVLATWDPADDNDPEGVEDGT